jgi:hypothetical protein
MATDPSGDVWVANCFASAQSSNVVRVDAKTLGFEPTLPIRATDGYYRGMAYGGGSVWVADASGGAVEGRRITKLNQRTRERQSIKLERHSNALAWSEGYGDLWMTNFGDESVSRRHVETADVETSESVAKQPGPLVVQGDSVWVGDWDAPDVVRLPAVGSGPPRRISLPMITHPAGSPPSLPAPAPSGRPSRTTTPCGASTRKPTERGESKSATTRGVSVWGTTGSGWLRVRTTHDPNERARLARADTPRRSARHR